VAHDRRFRFGVQAGRATSGREWVEIARKAEDLGYSTLSMPDHFVNQEFAPVPALAAAAAATTTLRVGTLVFDNDYKHPVVLAKEAATLDLLSDGRLEFGLGAGWQRTDYDAAGMQYDDPGVRVDRFEEGLAVIKGLWADGPFSFEGKHYRISELDGFPKPVQRPGPPVLVGGGAKRVLGIAGREADIVGINPNLRAGEVNADTGKDAAEESYLRKVQWIRDGAGERFDDIELHVLVFVCIETDDRDGVFQAMAGGFGLTPEGAAEVPLAVVGTVDQMCETLASRREKYGISYVTVQADAIDTLAPVVARLAGT
jgi:probable F420-dependent oxidoreductase